jgi:hypothetical protein
VVTRLPLVVDITVFCDLVISYFLYGSKTDPGRETMVSTPPNPQKGVLRGVPPKIVSRGIGAAFDEGLQKNRVNFRGVPLKIPVLQPLYNIKYTPFFRPFLIIFSSLFFDVF